MKNKFSFKKEYKKSYNYLKESKLFIYAMIFVFFFSAVLGFFVAPPEAVFEEIIKFIQELLATTKDLSHFGLVWFLFLNNIKSAFFSIMLGFFFGAFPIIACFANGYFLGVVSRIVVSEEGILSLWRLLPHGIFEIPAILISFGVGLKFGTFLFKDEKGKHFKKYFWNSVRIFLLIVLPLLIIAGIIEGSFIFFSR